MSYDAIVLGAGHNGLVTALYLARAGWKVLVLERNDRIGGAVMSGEVTRPGFISDLYSTNQNQFLGSPVYQELHDDLARHGLRYCTSAKPYSNIFPDGTSLRIYQDPDRTLEALRGHNANDAEGWSRLYDQFKLFRRTLLPLFQTPLPSAQAGWVLIKAARAVGLRQLGDLGQIALSSIREIGDAYLASPEARAILAPWGMHLDFGPDVSSGAVIPLLECFTDMEIGMSIVEGGASQMIAALAGLLNEAGGEIRTHAVVRRVITTDGRATGAELDSGERIAAKRAVIANLTPTGLFSHLLAEYPFSAKFRRQVQQYRYGPGTMMVHLALSGRPRWTAGEELGEFAYIHVAPSVDDLARTYTQALNGYLPASPMLVIGQTSVVDPSRAPSGQQVLWVQVRALPSAIRGDARGEITERRWEMAKEPFADRVMEQLESYAPGINRLVLDRVVFSPEDLERHDPNLVGGDSVAGSHHLRQNALYRPLPGWSTYRMPLDGLYMVGAATWPGGGVNGTSGYLAAQEILHPHEFRSQVIRGSVAVGAAAAAVAGAVRQWRRS